MNRINYLFVVIALLVACQDDESPAKQEPLRMFKTYKHLENPDVRHQGGSDRELAIAFSTSMPISLTDVVFRIPTAEEDVRITLWDVDSETIMYTWFVPKAEAFVECVYPTHGVELTPTRNYILSVRTRTCISARPVENYEAPWKTGPVTVYGNYFVGSTTPAAMPNLFKDDFWYGYLSFLFLPD